ncbi:MAG: ABC transporter permease, partial [Burkholderiales bacterium]
AFDAAETMPERTSRAVEEEELKVARTKRFRRIAQIAVGVGFLLLWELASGPLVDPFFVSSPSAVFAKLGDWLARGELFMHLGITLYATAIGFVVGSVLGFSVGFVFGRYEAIGAIFDPYITAIYCLPKIALAPLFIMWFGIGIESKIAMSAVIVFFLVFLNTYSGVRDVNPIHIHGVRIMGANEWQLLRTVIAPSAAAWVLTGLKVSVPYALIGTVVGEFMSSNRGVGFMIAQSSALFDTAGVFAGLALLATVGGTINELLKRLERHLLRWRG